MQNQYIMDQSIFVSPTSYDSDATNEANFYLKKTDLQELTMYTTG